VDPRLGRHPHRFLVLAATLGLVDAVAIVAGAGALAHGIAAVFRAGGGIGRDLVVVAVAVAVRAAVAWARESLAARAAAAAITKIRSGLLRRIIRNGPQWLAGQRNGELAHLASSGLDPIEAYFSRYLASLALTLVVPPVVIGWIWLADWPSALIIIATLPLIPLFTVLIGWRTRARTERQLRALGRLAHHFLDVVEGLTTLRAFGRAHAQERTIAEVTDRYRRTTMSVLRTSFLSTLALELAAMVSVALVAVQIGLRLVDGRVGLQTALLVLILAAEPYLPLRQVGANYHASADARAVLDRVFEVPDPPPPATSAIPLVAVHGLRVRDVSVRHPDRVSAALPATSFSLRAGELVAVVAPSGAGKSTLLAVLLGFVARSSGEVLVGGVDVAAADPAAWRAQVAWAPQRPTLLAGTVADNVRLGNPRASDDAVRRALALAAARDLHDAGDLRPGRVLAEDGAGLSAGQRQRITLARAFLRALYGGGLLLLDEPTAHLDADTEARVLAGIRELSRSRCVLMVVHRPAMAAAADRVVHLGAVQP
jgi:ATP-binding cassette, subfamily C, bacterial CydCD